MTFYGKRACKIRSVIAAALHSWAHLFKWPSPWHVWPHIWAQEVGDAHGEEP
jgi:hypothetical protein